MRIQQVGAKMEIRTKSLYAAAFLMTKGARYSGVEWLDRRNAEFAFVVPDGIDAGELIGSYCLDGIVPGKSYAENHSYLKNLLFQSRMEIINDKSNRTRLNSPR